MSKDLPQQPQQSEEVDLGQLFKMIGNLFERLFSFIKSIFMAVYKLLLLVLLHFYKRKLWYISAVILGLTIGYFIDKQSETLYGANMYIETNFKSARQVYENIKQFHQLASKDRDSIQLAQSLNIDSSTAAKLKGFYIEPDLDENYIVNLYSGFYKNLDSASREEVTYNEYKESLTPFDFKIHRIGVASTDKHLYKKIEENFKKEIIQNSYLEELVRVNIENLKREELALNEQLIKNDSLVKEYLRIRKNESEKPPAEGSGTNLYMGDSGSNSLLVDESKIIEKTLALEQKKRNVYSNLVEEKGVINVLAGFPQTGYDISEWTDKKINVLPLIFAGIILLVFSFLSIGRFLEREESLS